MNLSMPEALVLLSLFLAAPAMFVLLVAALSGSLSRNEKARYLPLRRGEPDVWETGRRDEPRRRGGTP